MPRRVNRALLMSSLEGALFGAGWDGDCAAQGLALYRAHPDSTHLQRAIAALHDAQLWLASAERFAAKLRGPVVSGPSSSGPRRREEAP